jgi:hypothetical protein
MNKTFPTKFIMTMTLFLGACGGGGDGLSVAGIDRLGVSNGTVSGFGSIFVNGVEFETNGAEFTVDDSPGSESSLSVGDVVIVSGTIDANGTTGTATSVFTDEAVEGPVDSIDLVNSRLVVAGQSVIVDAQTSFDDNISPADLNGLAVGNFIEISGLFDADQTIRATRIERKALAGIPAGRFVQVHGLVMGLDSANSTFAINGLTVDFSAATLDNFPGGAPSNGDFVEAKGVSFGGGGELTATKVEFEVPGIGNLDPGTIDDLEIEGFITRFVSATDFDVSGFPVTTNGQTIFEFDNETPATAADLGLNVKVEVEGDVDASGTLVASKVEIRRATVIRITGVVDEDPTSDTFVVLGVTIRVDSQTRVEDKSSADEEPFALAQLNAGDYVEMRGAEDVNGSGDVIAARLEREDFDTDTIVQGFVESVSQPSFSILGVTVDTSGTLIFRDVGGNAISAVDFFNDLDVGDVVKAKGLESSTTLVTAEEVEFEN